MTFTLSACGDNDDDENGVQVERPLTPEGSTALAVDLGLPSGTKWADRKIGADKSEAYGSFFAWCETSPASDCRWTKYKWGSAQNQLTKYCNKSVYGKDGFTDTKIVLDPDDDAASVNWGGKWHIPTIALFEELFANTINEWVTDYNGTGVNGYKFTNKNDASKFIFLPASGNRAGTTDYDINSAGDYWTSSLDTNYPFYALYLYFIPEDVGLGNSCYRYYGHAVRPVRP